MQSIAHVKKVEKINRPAVGDRPAQSKVQVLYTCSLKPNDFSTAFEGEYYGDDAGIYAQITSGSQWVVNLYPKTESHSVKHKDFERIASEVTLVCDFVEPFVPKSSTAPNASAK